MLTAIILVVKTLVFATNYECKHIMSAKQNQEIFIAHIILSIQGLFAIDKSREQH